MTYSVYQHWDPLRVCVVGRSYPPEFYSWITIPHVRELFEKIAVETEEDYQNIIRKLEYFGVQVLRPDLPEETFVGGRHVAPPMTPRDYTAMIGEKFYHHYGQFPHDNFESIRDPSWPKCHTWQEFDLLTARIKDECINVHKFRDLSHSVNCYDKIFDHIRSQGNDIIERPGINSAMISRIGRDLYFGTESYHYDIDILRNQISQEFSSYRNHIVNTGGHSDGTYCPVCPGLIISLHDVPTYAETFPDWEVVYLPGSDLTSTKPFMDLKAKNHGKWWIPGFEYDQSVVDVVETWLDHWTGFVEETVFDINMLIIDPKNVMVFNYNQQVFNALDRYGITPHVVPFRHRYFWDGGIHCVTSDLHRDGHMQDFFPNNPFTISI